MFLCTDSVPGLVGWLVVFLLGLLFCIGVELISGAVMLQTNSGGTRPRVSWIQAPPDALPCSASSRVPALYPRS